LPESIKHILEYTYNFSPSLCPETPMPNPNEATETFLALKGVDRVTQWICEASPENYCPSELCDVDGNSPGEEETSSEQSQVHCIGQKDCATPESSNGSFFPQCGQSCFSDPGSRQRAISSGNDLQDWNADADGYHIYLSRCGDHLKLSRDEQRGQNDTAEEEM
jgi:hypothetical protein